MLIKSASSQETVLVCNGFIQSDIWLADGSFYFYFYFLAENKKDNYYLRWGPGGTKREWYEQQRLVEMSQWEADTLGEGWAHTYLNVDGLDGVLNVDQIGEDGMGQ